MPLPVGEQAFVLESPAGPLDAVWCSPPDPVVQLVMAHGAGAGLHHATMTGLAEAFAAQSMATLRFNFPFMQQGKRRVDSIAVATSVIACAAGYLRSQNSLPLLLAGHSFGGRMCSHAVLAHDIPCQGLVFCAFPLHPAKRPEVKRAAHLTEIKYPMLFLSGTRDDLADPALLEKVVASLPLAHLYWLETANHSYTVLKRSRRNPTPVFTEMAQRTRQFVDEVI